MTPTRSVPYARLASARKTTGLHHRIELIFQHQSLAAEGKFGDVGHRFDTLLHSVDCAIDFPSAIGQQRIQFPLNYKHFRHGAHARTNSTASKKLYCQTIGKLFADVRNLGYTNDNVLIAGKKKYVNDAQLVHEGKSQEAVWHRAVLDLLAAIALIEEGRFVGKITSYKAGHFLDCEAVKQIYQHGLLTEVQPQVAGMASV